MKRISMFIFVLLFTVSCQTYSPGDLDGKWECTFDDMPYGLWVSDTLALGFSYESQTLILFEVDYNGNVLTFTNIHPWAGSTWKDQILSLESNHFELELQNPKNKLITRYDRVTDEIPDISPDYETNLKRYEELLKGKLKNDNYSR